MVLYTDGDSEEMNHADIFKNRKQAYKHLDSLHALIQRKLAPTADDMDSSLSLLSISTHSELSLSSDTQISPLRKKTSLLKR